ncbi:NPP1 family protein [Streptomyces sp. NPDC054837]
MHIRPLLREGPGPIGGRTHDWENVVVWQKRGQASAVVHVHLRTRRIQRKAFNQIERSGNRVKIVYRPGRRLGPAALVALDKLRSSNRMAFDAL